MTRSLGNVVPRVRTRVALSPPRRRLSAPRFRTVVLAGVPRRLLAERADETARAIVDNVIADVREGMAPLVIRRMVRRLLLTVFVTLTDGD